MGDSKRESWLEDIVIMINQYELTYGDKKKIVTKLHSLTKYNKHQLAVAYRTLYENDKLINFFNFDFYFKF